MLTIEQIKKLVDGSQDYNFMREDKNLKNIAFLGLGGSYAYGIANDQSDVDIRGIAFNSPEEILLGKDFEQVVDTNTDTTIYSLKKMVDLLTHNNPNTLEILGLNSNQVIYSYPEFYDNFKKLKDMVLSKLCVRTFGGYAQSQLRRLQNSAASVVEQEQREKHILNSIKFARIEFDKNVKKFDSDSILLYVDESDREDISHEIFIDVSMKHYPLRDFTKYANGFHGVLRDYDKLQDSRRNRRAKLRGKISKHMCHLVRLFFMCFDILSNHEVITYRKTDHDLLMKIRNGHYIDDNEQPISEFYTLVDSLEDKLQKLAKQTTLPDEPDYESVDKWLVNVHKDIVMGA